MSALGYRFQNADGSYRTLDARDIPIIMNCVKLAREVHKHTHDNVVDIHGYMNCLEMVIDRQNELATKA